MKRSTAALAALVVIFAASAARAQFTAAPRLVVNGPTTGTPGEILTFDFSETEGETLRYRVTIDPTLKGYKQVYHDGPTASRANIASFPGTYRVRIIAWNADGLDEWERVLVIPGTPPCPPPDPVPPMPPIPPNPGPPAPSPTPSPTPIPGPAPSPTPSPTPLPDTMGVSAQVVAAAKLVGDSAGSRALADKAEGLAAKIRAGGEKNSQSVINQIAAAIKEAGPKWTPFLAATKSVIQALILAGKLSTNDVQSLATFLEEVAAALRSAAA